MNNIFRRRGLNTLQPGGLFAQRQIFENILHGLAVLIQWTEEEKRDAGIYLGVPSQEIPVQYDNRNINSSHLNDKEKT